MRTIFYPLLFILTLWMRSSIAQQADGRNVLARPILFQKPCVQLPDLALSIISSPAQIKPDEGVSVRVRIQNKTGILEQVYALQVVVSADTVFSINDEVLYNTLHGALPASQDTILDLFFRLPLRYTLSGPFWLLATIDAPNAIEESNENNNNDLRPVHVALYSPPAHCQQTYGTADILCIEPVGNGNIALYAQHQNQYNRLLLNEEGHVLNTGTTQPLVYDSVWARKGQVVKKAANGAILFQKSIPTTLLAQYPILEAAAELRDGTFVLAGFQKYYDPQGILPLNNDSLVLLRTDADLNLLKATVVKRNTRWIQKDRVHALIPLADGGVALAYTWNFESTIIASNLILVPYTADLQEKSPAITWPAILEHLTQTPCGSWKIEAQYQSVSLKGQRIGDLRAWWTPDDHKLQAELGIGVGSVDYYGTYKYYQFRSLRDSLTVGLLNPLMRTATPLTVLYTRYILSSGAASTDSIPFLQFRYAMTTPQGKLMLFGVENDSIWGVYSNCYRSVATYLASETPPGLLVYPNPASDHLSIQLDKAQTNGFEATLFDGIGRVLRQGRTNGPMLEWSLYGLPAGIYWVQVAKYPAQKVVVR